MKKKWIYSIFLLLLPVIVGSFVGFITKNHIDYNILIKPVLSPPSTIFPIMWTILYLLMGISIYIIYREQDLNDKRLLTIYYLQLFVNLLWSIIFFVFKLRLLAFIWILLLIGLVILMILEFYKANKKAAFLQIPYLLWLIFAAYLNLGIYILNR